MILSPPRSRARTLLGALALLSAGGASAAPSSVALVGSVQPSPCTGTDPTCAATSLAFDTNDNAWQGTLNLAAGSYTFRAAVTEGGVVSVYGQGGTANGADFTLDLPTARAVKFYYDHGLHWVTNNTSVIAVAPGSFQSELGCPGDWQPDCLRTWLKDVDGDGIYSFTTTGLPAGSYEGKVAINESWDENYGADGARGGANIGFSVPSDGLPVIFTYNATSHVLRIQVEGAPRGDIALRRAHWVSGELLVWNPSVEIPTGATVALHYDPSGAMTLGPGGISGGQSITLTRETVGLPGYLQTKFPHLVGKPVFRIADADLIKVKDILKGQVALSLKNVDGNSLDATGVQVPGVLDALYANDAALGVTWSGAVPTFRLWAPTARNVTVRLYNDSTTTFFSSQPLSLDAATGVWSATGASSLKGKYYLYEVEVYVPALKAVVKNLVTDPYSLSLSLNSTRSQLVDLTDAALAPTGWSTLVKPALAAPEDIVLYELHVRDFSIQDATVSAARRGSFLAFTEPDSNGMKHLRGLASKGLTHVHLLPAFDIATIEEERAKQKTPAGDLSAYAPDSEMQQAAVNAVKDADGFNWGYDPYHYTVPEGSYAVNPEGSARILEFRQMVKALSDSGLRVVMDVVYNHTAVAGQADKSVLDRVVPGYYQRLNADGNIETSTCCQNTASEHAMFEKLMVDSLVTWAKFYKVDGFRFDLMGHHMKANLLKVQERLRALTLAKDGVDGSKIYLYGEGWDFGEVANNARGTNATQLNMPGTGIGTFSDRLRDAARGGGPFSGLQEQGFISGLWYDPNTATSGSAEDQRQRLLHSMDQIRVGLAGNLRDYTFINKDGTSVKGSQVDYNGQPAGYTLDPQEVITYVSAHDNETLFDAVQMKAPASADIDTRVRMHNMGLSLVALGQGIPFFHAGDELLRSKSLDRNSYNSGDWFNHLDFTYASNNWGVGLPPEADNKDNWPVMRALLANAALKPGPTQIHRALDHFGELLRIRKSAALFRLRTAAEVQAHVRFLNTGTSQVPGLVVMNVVNADAADGYTDAVVFFNAQPDSRVFHIDEYVGRSLQLHPVQQASTDAVLGGASFQQVSGDFIVPGRSTVVFLNTYVPPADAGTPDAGGDLDAGPGPGGDAGTPVDAGSDAGTPVDAGSDAGTPVDAGSDAGTPGSDGGTTPTPTPDGGQGPGADAGTTPGTDAGGDVPSTEPIGQPGGCGGCAGGGAESFSALALLLGGVLRARRRV